MDAVFVSREKVNPSGAPTCSLPTEEDFQFTKMQSIAFSAAGLFADIEDISNQDKARLSKLFLKADGEYFTLFEESGDRTEKEKAILNKLRVAIKEIEHIAVQTGKSFNYIAYQVLPKVTRSINYDWALADLLNER